MATPSPKKLVPGARAQLEHIARQAAGGDGASPSTPTGFPTPKDLFQQVVAATDDVAYSSAADPRSPYCALASQTPDNVPQNRYSNIFPFDRNCVPIAGSAQTPYINASWIEFPLTSGTTRDRAHIATQGPLPHTIGAFWRMVHQHGSPLIVCLTKQKEGGRVKYDPYYLPNDQFSVPYDDGSSISIAHVATETIARPGELLAAYRRHVELGARYRFRPEHTPRAITQIHNLTLHKFVLRGVPDPGSGAAAPPDRDVWIMDSAEWPDHQAIDADALLSMVELARFINPSIRSPMVVHCSAGCGRTGTFIAVDCITRYLESGIRSAHFDHGPDLVAQVVADLKTQRVQMVQSLAQFELVYRAVARYMWLMGYL
ncbi:protein-tyrosine phosphatase-like protein [Blastocladiella britannica]|nr:protein-tyrosine phosphatase-like protein [Blastocladiella britannica]